MGGLSNNQSYEERAQDILRQNPEAPEVVAALVFYLKACDRNIIQSVAVEDFKGRFIFKQSLTGWLFCFDGQHWHTRDELKGFTLIHRLITSRVADCEGIPAIDLDAPDFDAEAVAVAQNFTGSPLFGHSTEYRDSNAVQSDERYKRQLKQAAIKALQANNPEDSQMLVWQAISEGVSFTEEERHLGIKVMDFWPKKQFIQAGILPESMRLDINPVHNEAARNVYKAIRRAITAFKTKLPTLADHLSTCISRENNRFYYDPNLDNRNINWETR